MTECKTIGGKERRRVRLSEEQLSRFSVYQEAIMDKRDLRSEADQRG